MAAPACKASLGVDAVAQEKDYTCGPASLRAVLSYWGIRRSEKALAKEAHTTMAGGTSHAGMVAAARACGMYTESMYDSSITDLEMYVDKGMPVIVNFMLGDEDEAQGLRYGHYSVVAGYDGGSLCIMDVDGGRERGISKSSFESIWFSEVYGRKWMLVLHPRQPPGRKARKRK